jgi:tetratricopeptide (TPR) repeat protein
MNSDTWYKKGNKLSALGMYKEAIECYDMALEINPSFIEALNNKGLALKRLGRFEEAIECFDQALRINPTYVRILNNKGIVLFKLGRYEEAIRQFELVLELDKENFVAKYNKELAELIKRDR